MRYGNLTHIRSVQLLALYLVFFTACANSSPFYFERAMAKGGDEYSSGDFEAAEKAFLEALQLAEKRGSSPQIVIVLGYLGRTYDQEGKEDLAGSAFNRRLVIADSEHLDAETRVETRLAAAMFYSKHRHCDETKRLLDDLSNTSDPDIRSSKDYSKTISLISDLSRSQCNGSNTSS